ncbi:MAG: glucosaminidase domain-containing protein [Chitinophagaceae bacterium]|nr:glucosaminidase domain-containing protein [Chitinophagaceae bacterium]
MRVFTVFLMFCLSGLATAAQPTNDIIEYINTYKQLAIEEMHRTGVPASITLAQGIHETYAGKSELVLKSNNHFGIKCKSYWTGKKVYHDDDARGECFRKYDKPDQSYRDHSDFLKAGERYAPLFKLDPEDYKGWAQGLKKAGYATNPKYAPIIIKLVEDYNLQQYSLIALGKMAPEDEIIATVPKPASDVPDISAFVRQQDALPEIAPPPSRSYPTGEFTINNTRVIFARQGTAMLAIAQEYDIPLRKLLEFNDMEGEEVLVKDQLVYLQRKRRTGTNDVHVVSNGETLHDISQAEAIRLADLLEYNNLHKSVQPTVGDKLYLKAMSREKL